MALPVINFAAIPTQGNSFARDFGDILRQGLMFPGQMKQQQLANALSQVQAQYAQPQAEAELQKQQLFNKFYPQVTQAQLNQIQTENALKKAQMQKLQTELSTLNSLHSESNGKIDKTNSGSDQISNNAPYGIPTPQPTRQDYANKDLFGIDTYSTKLQHAIAQQQNQVQEFSKKNTVISQDAENLQKNLQLMNQFDYWTDKMNVGGKLADYTPNLSTASQNAQQIANEMSLTGMQAVRQAMDSARFSNLDTNIALGMKPQIGWNKDTRKRYKDYLGAVYGRTAQMRDFYTYIAHNPQLAADKSTADALWSIYQEQYPITSRKGDSFIVRDRNEWQKFATPEAIQSVKQTGYYRPINKSHVTEENIKDTIKATGLSRDEVIAKLKERNLM